MLQKAAEGGRHGEEGGGEGAEWSGGGGGERREMMRARSVLGSAAANEQPSRFEWSRWMDSIGGREDVLL